MIIHVIWNGWFYVPIGDCLRVMECGDAIRYDAAIKMGGCTTRGTADAAGK